jgi:hypothetical protein
MERREDALFCACGHRTPITFQRPTQRPRLQTVTVHCSKCRQPHTVSYSWEQRKVVRVVPLVMAKPPSDDTIEILRDVLGFARRA